MKLYSRILLLLLFPVLLSACEKTRYSMDNDVNLRYQNPIIVISDDAEVEVEFTKLVEDSRCMGNKMCIWGGRFTGEFLLNGQDKIYLSLGDLRHLAQVPKHTSDVYQGHTFTLLKAEIEPEDQRKARKYRITLKVSK
ncbi:MAG: hypothetical protein EP332_12960 [Bacteroidetes bacterium]|nr:MAG: hypothetical protein EP332_12960 [Bacteroidota bacterium]